MSQGELLPVSHRSPHRRRLAKRPDGSSNAERIYAAEWLRKTRQKTGAPFLPQILFDDRTGQPGLVSRRDAAVAAMVIQWLGTAVGLGFVMHCEDLIDRANKKILWPLMYGRASYHEVRRKKKEERDAAQREVEEAERRAKRVVRPRD